MEHRLLCGWRVDSAFALPELLPWPGPDEVLADVTIVAGTVPDDLDDALNPGEYLVVGRSGAVLIRVPGLVRLLVTDGTTITVDQLGNTRDEGWRLFLLGSAVGVLCHQRGLFPLHAASLRIGGRTIAVAGRSGAGKSTLSLELTRRGHGLLSDDLTVLHLTGEATVLPAFPRLKLWRDTLEAGGIDPSGLSPVRRELEKYDLPSPTRFDPTPTPLAGIVTLGDADGEPVLYDRSRTQALSVLSGYVFRPRAGFLLGRQAALFAQTAVIARTVPVCRLERPRNLAMLARTATLIEERFAR